MYPLKITDKFGLRTLFIILTIILANSCSTSVNIYDENFKQYLLTSKIIDSNGNGVLDSNIDINKNGKIELNEAELILNLDISDQNIYSLEGIDKFINIQTLNCSNNKLTKLYLNKNLKLETLNCSQNKINNLNLKTNIGVKELVCHSNEELTQLDLSNNLSLEILKISGSGITKLDITKNNNLRIIECNSNPINNINVSHCVNLKNLSVNFTNINRVY